MKHPILEMLKLVKRVQHGSTDLSYRHFLTAVAVVRKPNAIPLCFSIDVVLNFLLSWLLVLLPSIHPRFPWASSFSSLPWYPFHNQFCCSLFWHPFVVAIPLQSFLLYDVCDVRLSMIPHQLLFLLLYVRLCEKLYCLPIFTQMWHTQISQYFRSHLKILGVRRAT